MKKKLQRRLIISATTLFAASMLGAAGVAFADDELTYYVCFSTDNYRMHAMTEQDGVYTYSNIRLTSSDDFYVTDGQNSWYGTDDYQRNLHVEESTRYAYDIFFDPQTVNGTTKSHIYYDWHMLDPVTLTATDEQGAESELTLTYNPWQTGRDEYYLSSTYLTTQTQLSYTTGSGVLVSTYTYDITESGYYRVLYTPENVVGFSQYGYDENGSYGAGSSYTYHIFAELAPQYLLALEGAQETDYIPLVREEKNTSSAEYRTQEALFLGDNYYDDKDERYELYYKVYRKDYVGETEVLTLLDDGNAPDDDNKKEDADLSILTQNDKANYKFALTDSGSAVSSSLVRQNSYYGGFYALGTLNNYGYTPTGESNLEDVYRFTLIGESDERYNKDYAQYTLTLTLTSDMLEEDDVSLLITDGQSRYRNGTSNMVLNTAGVYTFTFSDEHVYSNGRRYQYSLEREQQTYTRVEVGTVEEWNTLAQNCRNADWSADKEVHLTADISFAEKTFTPLPVFTGVLMGDEHTLSYIVLIDSNKPTCVVEKLADTATLSDLTIANVLLGGKDCEYVGVVGQNYGLVKNITVSGNLSGKRYVGGIVAYNGTTTIDDTSASTDAEVIRKGKIEGCTNLATISGVGDVGGIAGFSAGDILTSQNTQKITGKAFRSDDSILDIGGIAGYSSGRISACSNTATVGAENTGFYVGGIVGLCTGGVYFSTNSGAVYGRRYAGGLVGYYGTLQQDSDWSTYFGVSTMDAIMNAYTSEEQNSNDSSSQSQGNENVIAYCQNSGAITSVRYAGGVLGNSTVNSLTMSYLTNSGAVSTTGGDYAGGIAGYCTASLVGCYSMAAVRASGNYAGGLVGYGNGISQSAATGVVRATEYAGGLAGYINSGNVYSNYANVALLADKTARYTGNIAGGASAVEGSLAGLSNQFYANYYVGDSEWHYGIARIGYGKTYSYAAAEITVEALLAVPTYKNFDKDFWVAGEGTFPVPVHYTLGNADEDVKDLYDDDALFDTYFANLAPNLTAFAAEAAKPYAVTLFMEWNEDDGDLYDEDDGTLNVANFVILDWIRTPYGEEVKAPALLYATAQNGHTVFEGDDATYFVTLNGVASVAGNTVQFATYDEVITTLRSADGNALAEGMFYEGTTLTLQEQDGQTRAVFTRNGEVVEVGEVVLKLHSTSADRDEILMEGTKQASKVVGDYVSFTYQQGQAFTVHTAPLYTGLLWWGWLLIGLAIACGAAAIISVVVLVVRRKRKKV